MRLGTAFWGVGVLIYSMNKITATGYGFIGAAKPIGKRWFERSRLVDLSNAIFLSKILKIPPLLFPTKNPSSTLSLPNKTQYLLLLILLLL